MGMGGVEEGVAVSQQPNFVSQSTFGDLSAFDCDVDRSAPEGFGGSTRRMGGLEEGLAVSQPAFGDLSAFDCDKSSPEGFGRSNADCDDVGTECLVHLAAEKRSDRVLTLTTGRPCRIITMGEQWAQLLGLRTSDAKGRSFGMLSGPNTDMSTVKRIVEGAQTRSQETQRITLYTKSGDPVDIDLVACARAADQVEFMLTASPVSEAARASDSSTIEATFLADEPHLVKSATAAFHEAYRYDARTLASKGLSALFGWRTDGQRWKNLIKRAQQGAVATSPVYTYSCTGNELCTRLTVAPAASSSRLRLSVEVLPSYDHECRPAHRSLAAQSPVAVSKSRDAGTTANWPPTSCEEAGSNATLLRSRSAESSSSSSSSHGSSREGGAGGGLDESLRVHLQVMKMHRAMRANKKRETRSATLEPSAGT